MSAVLAAEARPVADVPAHVLARPEGRPARARVNLDALRHNYTLARTLHGGRAFAVLKADAYGHGASACAAALRDLVDGYAVAFLDEAEALRAQGVTGPLLVLEGVFSPAELRRAHQLDLWVVVHHEAQVRMIEAAPPEVRGLFCWLKADTGMRRAGFDATGFRSAYARLQASGRVAQIGLMSHLACADEPDNPATQAQLAQFEAMTAGLPGPRSLCNSAGVLAWPGLRQDWARPGIMLYGATPMAAPEHPPLQAVMTLESEVFAVRTLVPGDRVGYGGTFTAQAPMRIGLVAMGYADGYPRQAHAGTPIAVAGQATRLAGRVSMDMLMVDLTHLPQAGEGARVELWGPQVPVNAVAESVGTIAYELLCRVRRVPLVYEG